MPTTRLTVAPSTTDTHVEVWVCTICGRDATLVDRTGSALAAVEFFLEQHGWRQLPTDEVVCDRCKNFPDIANILLAAAKARTQ